jgi:hypothetical protein
MPPATGKPGDAVSIQFHEPAMLRSYLATRGSKGGKMAKAKIETDTLEELLRRPQYTEFLEAIGGWRFLAGQFVTILGTIFGVYLAAYVGFQRNLEYDRFVQAQQRSDLLMALREELKQNMDRLRKFNERLPANVGTGVLNTEWPHLRLFVWQAAGRSTSALDMPQIMIEVQSVYDDVNDMLNDADAHQMFRSLTSSNVYDRTRFKERLNDQLKLIEDSIFPAIDAATTASGQRLKQYSEQ